MPPIRFRVRAPSAAREILGVDTSTAAFVGEPASGSPKEPVLVTSMADYEQAFGSADDDLRRAVRLFFDNEGRRAYVLRPQSDIVGELDKLDDVSFALLAVPDMGSLPPGDAGTVGNAAVQLCEHRRAFVVLDAPTAIAPEDVPGWAGSFDTRRAAVYVPRLKVPGAETASSGAVLGVYARTDMQRGVWKAPAGGAADVRGAVGVTETLSDETAATLNLLRVNAIRSVSGRLELRGARTLDSDPLWKYVSISRFAMFLERSIGEGLRWAAFEPNGEALWREVRLSVGGFLNTLFLQGALGGSTPNDAYFVQCGPETMTQDDIDNGRLIIIVGFAPHRPAEFVSLRISQFA
jgi:phage tail sheath protein FI